MCEFCKNIGKMKRVRNGGYVASGENIIFHRGQYDIWYYGECEQDICVENIKLCPMCGRKLNETEG